MASILRSALVNYSAEQVFDVVNDVESYPQFLPGCAGSSVFESSDELMRAELRLGRAGVSLKFITLNRLKRPEYIKLTLDHGPFSTFSGEWLFKPLGDSACKVSFQLDFRMKNPLLGKAMGTMMAKVSNDMVDAVTRELKRRYD